MIKSIEKGLQHIEKTNTEKINLYNNRIEFHQDAISKYEDGIQTHRLLFSKVIYESALFSNNCCENVDREFNKLFPQVGDDEIPPLGITQPFNPKIIVEFRDNKPSGLIKLWDTEKGVLPNVMVYNTYFVNRTDNPIWYDTARNTACNGEGFVDAGYNDIDDSDVYRYHPKFNTDNEDVNELMSYKFEVDNYLNLYEPNTGLYLMFNKTSFPDCALKFRNYQYEQKEVSNFNLNEMVKYSDEKILETVRNLVPNNIEDVYNYHNSYRQSKAFVKTFDAQKVSVNLDEDNCSYTSWDETDEEAETRVSTPINLSSEQVSDSSIEQNVEPEQNVLTVDTKDFDHEVEEVKKLPLIDISPSGSDEIEIDSEFDSDSALPENEFKLQEEILEFSKNHKPYAVAKSPESPKLPNNMLWFSKWNDVVEEIKERCEEFDKEEFNYVY